MNDATNVMMDAMATALYNTPPTPNSSSDCLVLWMTVQLCKPTATSTARPTLVEVEAVRCWLG